MKNLELLSVQEMNAVEMTKVDGGVPMDWYMDDATIAANGALAGGALDNFITFITLFL